jgi:hypothetical protein
MSVSLVALNVLVTHILPATGKNLPLYLETLSVTRLLSGVSSALAEFLRSFLLLGGE